MLGRFTHFFDPGNYNFHFRLPLLHPCSRLRNLYNIGKVNLVCPFVCSKCYSVHPKVDLVCLFVCNKCYSVQPRVDLVCPFVCSKCYSFHPKVDLVCPFLQVESWFLVYLVHLPYRYRKYIEKHHHASCTLHENRKQTSTTNRNHESCNMHHASWIIHCAYCISHGI